MKATVAALLGFLLWAAPAAMQAQIGSGDGYNYAVNGNHTTITITGYTGPAGPVTIPSNINNLLVTGVGNGTASSSSEQLVFAGTGVTSVVIPGSVSSIGFYAFANCTSLASVTIPGSVTNIGDFAFLTCRNLTNATIANGVPTVPQFAFASCGLTSLTVPASVSIIQIGAFESCTNLTSLTISEGVADIQQGAFGYCELTNVAIPASVTNVDPFAFGACINLAAITVDADNSSLSGEAGVLFDKHQTRLIAFPGAFSGTYTIPSSVGSIGQSAFEPCPNLVGVIIPDSVTNIGTLAFAGCSNMTSITIPDSVYSISDSTFELYTGLTNVTLPRWLGDFGPAAFQVCTSLTTITIPPGVYKVDEYAFIGCTNLTSIYFQGDAPDLGSAVFYGDSNLTIYIAPCTEGWGTNFQGSPVLPFTFDPFTYATNGGTVTITGFLGMCDDVAVPATVNGLPVTSVERDAFVYPARVTMVVVPKSITNMADHAFIDCFDLAGIFFQGNAPVADANTFYFSGPTVYYLPGTTGWEQFASNTGFSTLLWNPVIETDDDLFGYYDNSFNFRITGTPNIPVVIEACTNLTNPVWVALQTVTLDGGYYDFSDFPQCPSPPRFYRIRSP